MSASILVVEDDRNQRLLYQAELAAQGYTVFLASDGKQAVRMVECMSFDLIVMDGYLSKPTVEKVKQILESPIRREIMVLSNYDIAARHYSYAVLRNNLNAIMSQFFGHTVDILSDAPAPPEKEPHFAEKPVIAAYSK